MLRLDSAICTNGLAIPKAKEFLVAKIKESRELLKARKGDLTAADYKKQRDIIEAQRRFYQCLFGFKF